MSYISQCDDRENLSCSRCGGPAQCVHHIVPFSDGGDDSDENRAVLCFKCHHQEHATQEDWIRWGRKGGLQTSKNPLNWMNKLKQWREMRATDYDLWCQWVDYFTGERELKPALPGERF